MFNLYPDILCCEETILFPWMIFFALENYIASSFVILCIDYFVLLLSGSTFWKLWGWTGRGYCILSCLVTFDLPNSAWPPPIAFCAHNYKEFVLYPEVLPISLICAVFVVFPVNNFAIWKSYYFFCNVETFVCYVCDIYRLTYLSFFYRTETAHLCMYDLYVIILIFSWIQ